MKVQRAKFSLIHVFCIGKSLRYRPWKLKVICFFYAHNGSNINKNICIEHLLVSFHLAPPLFKESHLKVPSVQIGLLTFNTNLLCNRITQKERILALCSSPRELSCSTSLKTRLVWRCCHRTGSGTIVLCDITANWLFQHTIYEKWSSQTQTVWKSQTN